MARLSSAMVLSPAVNDVFVAGTRESQQGCSTALGGSLLNLGVFLVQKEDNNQNGTSSFATSVKTDQGRSVFGSKESKEQPLMCRRVAAFWVRMIMLSCT
ncbi:hypothetical protein QIS74_08874 [Colletotrichum tabaci]|uniref:Uncharacterized protein n=1 Tax=Colletotrichum tabaci TaxID=1209068 RepID=A0AAV9T2W6_9PEZI